MSMSTLAPSLVSRTKLEGVQLARLFQHVRKNNKEEIQRIAESGIPNILNYRDGKTGETALSLAASSNNEELVEFLLKVGSHPDVVDGYGRTAIMRAAAYGHVETVEVLAAAGADLLLQDSSGRGVLFYCSTVGGRHIRCAEICISSGADVNCSTFEGVPVLVVACESANDCLSTCLLMIERGADPTSTDKRNKRSALMAACKAGAVTVVKELLFRGADVNAVMIPTFTNAAHDAAMAGHLNVLQALSAYRVNFEAQDEGGNTPLHFAAQGGHDLCCRFLGQRGCNPKVKNNGGKIARQLAKEGKFKAAAKECRRAEAAFGKPIKNGESWALTIYDFTCVQYDQLLELFVKFDIEGNGLLPVEDFVDVLQSAGAPLPDEDSMRKLIRLHEIEKTINYRDFLSTKKYVNKKFQLTSYEKKKKKGSKGGRGGGGKTKVVMVVCTQDEENETPALMKVSHKTDLSRFGRDKRPEHDLEDDSAWYLDQDAEQGAIVRMSDAVRFRDVLSLQNAIQNEELEVNGRDQYYKTALMYACMKGDINMVKYLCQHGADVNAEDNFKWTPLHFACHCGVFDVVEYLLESGAALESRSLNGCTPLMHAIQSSNQHIVQLLLNKGAKLRTENRKGQTPMDLAQDFSDHPVYSVIKTRWDALPPLKDKNNRNQTSSAAPRSSRQTAVQSVATLRPATSADGRTTVSRLDMTPAPVDDLFIVTSPTPVLNPIPESKLNPDEDITYHLLETWSSQLNSDQLIAQHRERRERFGWQSDFADYKLPFINNVMTKISTGTAAE